MKKLSLFYLLMFFLSSATLFAQTEMKYWALPPQKADFTGASPTSTTIPVLNGPSAVYANGNLYYTDQLNNSIKAYSGTFDDVAGNGVAGFTNSSTPWSASFNQPAGIVMDASLNIYVADKANNVIRKISSSNVVTTFAGSGTAGFVNATGTSAQFNQPMGLAIDGSNNIYVADYGNHSIRKITSAGVVTTVAGSGFANFINGTGTGASFNNPTALVRDASGNLYVSDYGNNSIRQITSTGVVTTFAGAATAGLTNATGTSARFSGPFGITIDGSGNLYVSEKGNHTVRKIVVSTKAVTTLAGNGTSGNIDGTGSSARFNAPAGITFDGTNIIVADYGNKSLRQVTTAGIVTTLSATASSYVTSNSVYDGSGNILFYVKDDYILTPTGATAGRLTNYGALDSKNDLTNDIEIVPVPGTCRDFFIIYGFNTSAFTTDLHYTWISISGAGVITILYDGLLIANTGGNFAATAVSKIHISTNTRDLYVAGSNDIYQHSITSSGIFSGSSIYHSSTAFDTHDIDLSPDGSVLAWSPLLGSGGNAIVNLLTTGGTPTYSSKSISIGSYTGSHGTEFSADNLSLYLSLNSSITVNKGIYKLNISAGTSSMISGTSGHYGTTQLEIAGDGYLYAIDGNSTPNIGMLGRISPSDVLTNAILTDPVLSNYGTNSTGYTSLYRLPSQVHGQDYSYFFGVDKPNTTFTINGSATSPTSALNTFTCSTITLGSSASTATAYSITVNSADASGNIIAGYSYTTGLIASTPSASIDVKALNSSYLASHIGYYLITFYAQNSCANRTTSALIQNSSIPAATSNFKVNDGGGSSFSPNLILPGTNVSAYGVGLSGSYSTGYVATYQIKVDKVDCTTGAVLTSNVVNTSVVNVTNGDPSTISGVSFNTLSSPHGYFANPSNAGCFNITYTVGNACGSNAQNGYFNCDANVWRLGMNNNGVTTNAYPNPSNGITNISFNSQKATQVKVTLLPMEGSRSYTVLDKQSVGEGINEISFDAGTFPAGVYLYQVSDAEHTILSGKLVITK
jgi:hypothetical protein